MSSKFSSVSPIDGETVWESDATSTEHIQATVMRSASAATSWRAMPLESRVGLVRDYAQHLKDHRKQIVDLIIHEVGKLRWDAEAEVGAAIAKIELSIQALQERRSQSLIDGPGEVQRSVRYQPLGVALVLGPFNFPLHLPGGQIVPALLAGNSVVFKPSEQATAVGMWIDQAWREVGLPEDVFQTILGGVDVAISAIESPDIAAVFLTGSRSAGRDIHRQLAGRPGVLLALELGGNNPIVITESADVARAASTVSFSAFVSAGQRCTCSRRAIFVGDQADEHVNQLIKVTHDLRVGMPGSTPGPQIGPVISREAAASLRQTYEQLLQLQCQPVIPFEWDRQASNLVRPAIVDATGLSPSQLKELGDMEWFGPLLVIQRVDRFEDAVGIASNTSYGLAAALLGGTAEMFDRFVNEIGAGVVNWNGPTTGAAGALPFGGLGDSGNHRPAGYFAIDFCSDPVASLQRSELASADPWESVK